MRIHKALPYNRIIALMIIVYSAMQIYCINQLSINYDEGSFASYGTSLLKFQGEKDVVQYESKLPITALNMIPRALQQIFKPNLKKTWPEATSDIIHGRYVSLFVSILLGLLIFKWSKEIYNEKTALLVLLLYLLCPNFLAHGIFVSSDIFACFFITMALYYLWNFFHQQKTKYFILMSVATGLAQVSKFSMVHLFIIIPLLSVTICLSRSGNDGITRAFSIRKTLVYSALFIFVNWFIICTSHLFYQVFLPIKDYTFISVPFKGLQHFFLNSLPGFPIPLPSSYTRSMDAVIYFDQLGGGVNESLNGAPYILGKSSTHGFWYYYFVVLFFKLPIPVLLLWLSSVFWLFRNFSKRAFFRDDIFFIVPSLYFIIYMSFFYSTQVGIRHIMIIFPLLYILSGRLIVKIFERKKQFVLYLLLAYEIISVFSYFPHFLPYTNEFILDKKMAYKKIADTNLSYGEGYKYLKEYLDKHRDVFFQPDKPIAGKIIIEANKILNLSMASIHKYDWISPVKPVDHIHSQYLLFEISQNTADSLQKPYR